MHAAADTPTACENCGTALQGAYCHACGQGAHNPLHDVKHALEEVFESFWHLDGRVFRTLRDLLVPGRVACNYLAGQRVRYIPPLRLFLVLTVLTFFVGHFVVGTIEESPSAREPVQVQIGGTDAKGSPFRTARSEAEVQARLDRELADLAQARRETGALPLIGSALEKAEQELRAQADARRAELRAQGATSSATAKAPVTDSASTRVAAPTTGSTPTALPTAPATASKHMAATTPGSAPAPATATPPVKPRPGDKTGAEAADQMVRMLDSARLADPKRPWDATSNPADISWLPPIGDRWFNHRLANAASNIDRMKKDGQSLFFELMLAAIPSALFVLVPVFALLLRVFYLLSPRSWLEHLVIALYSHAFLLLTLFGTFVVVLLPLSSVATGWIVGIGWLWAGIYLLLMQHRVYRQHWLITGVKFLAIGFLYQFLLMGAVVYIAFAGLSSGA
jgi:hypothetical protein